jgi:arylamine N-acetyltransferase
VSTQWARTYLSFLGVEPTQVAADLGTLRRLARAQCERVLFENVTSILRRSACAAPHVPPLDAVEVLDRWVAGRSGGVCFEVTYMFGRLLREIGFNAYPILAKISFPGSHMAVVVELQGGRFMLDVGNGAPFNEPIPLDQTSEVRAHGLAYRFRPAEEDGGAFFQDRWIDGQWAQFVEYNLDPASADAREAAYQRHHTRGSSWVVDELRLVRSSDAGVWALRGSQLSSFVGSEKRVEQIEGREAIARVAAEVFGIPRLPVLAALEVLADNHV